MAYQSGLVAVEGCAELDVKVITAARQVDVGELADAEYQPGRRLLGAYGFVGDPQPLNLYISREPGYRLYPVIVQECELDTNLSPDGQSQTQARFKLHTTALFLQVKLPAKAELWSAELDGTPLKPQRQGDSLLIDVPAGRGDAPQTLQIVYAAAVDPVASRGTVAVPAPKLLLRAEQKGTATEVPLADLVWRLHLPSGYDVVGSGGTVATDELKPTPPAAVQVAQFLFGWNDALSRFGLLGLANQRACRSAKSVAAENNLKQIGLAMHNYAYASKVCPPSVIVDRDAITGKAGRPQREITLEELDRLVANDPVARQLSTELGWKKMDQAYTEGQVKPQASNPYADRYGEEVKKLQKQYEERVNKLRVLARGRAAFARDMRSGKDELSALPLDDNKPLDRPDNAESQRLAEERRYKHFSMDLAEKKASEEKSARIIVQEEEGVVEEGVSEPLKASAMGGLPTMGKQDLLGTRSLKINLLQTPAVADEVLTFRSLGVDPELVVTLANRQRLSALGWGLALIVVLVGVAITRRPARKKATLILAVMAAATIVPLLTGGFEIAYLCNMMFYAACWLIPYYVAAFTVRALWGSCRRAYTACEPGAAGATATKSAAMLLFAIAIAGANVLAKPQAALAGTPESSGPYVVQVVEPPAPVNVPDDAHAGQRSENGHRGQRDVHQQ